MIISPFFSPHHAAEWEKWHSWCRASADSLLSHGRSPVNGRWSAAVAPGNVLLLLFLSPRQQHRHWHLSRTYSRRRPAAAAGGRSPILTNHTAAHWRRHESTHRGNQSYEHVFHFSWTAAEQLFLLILWQTLCSNRYMTIFTLVKILPEIFFVPNYNWFFATLQSISLCNCLSQLVENEVTVAVLRSNKAVSRNPQKHLKKASQTGQW